MTKVWITGGKGFIGRHLAKFISSPKIQVSGLGHGSWTDAEFRRWGFTEWFNADIDFASLTQLSKQSGAPDTIIHLAGGSAVGPSLEHPFEDFQRTVDCTARLLDWTRQYAPEVRIVAASSAAVYGSGFISPISESESSTPFSPYGFHKSMLESLFASYRASFELDLSVVRLFSVYGSGLKKQLIWDICRKLHTSETKQILLHGTGGEMRDWLHIDDAVRLLWKVVHAESEFAPVINGGTGEGVATAQVFDMVSNAWGGSHKAMFSGQCRKGDPTYLVADTTLSKRLGFNASVTLPEGIKDVVRWYKQEQM